MKRTYYKEAMIGRKPYKGDKISITIKDDEVVIMEYVDFVDGRCVKTAQYNYPLTTMTFEDACRKYVRGGYKEIERCENDFSEESA